MSLNEHEQKIFDQIVTDIKRSGSQDLIEHAADDFRMIRAAMYSLELSDVQGPLDHYNDLRQQIAEEYLINPEQVDIAMGIVEDRIEHGKA